MAMNGSFAGGLADGMRNGMAIAQAYDLSKDRQRAREEADRKKRAEGEIAAAMAGGNAPLQAPAGLDQVRIADAVGVGSATPGLAGLEPVRVNAPVSTAGAPDLSTVGMSDASPGAQWGAGTAVRPGATALAAEKKSPQAADFLGGGDFGQVADGLTRAYRKALELGEPGRAMELLTDRERFVGQHREQAFATAQSRYQLTGDPNSFVPFVNRFMPGGIEVTSINRRAEQAGGAPLYDFVGVDTATGKPVQQPITEHMLQSFVQSISDPRAQQAMVAQQAKLLYQAEEKRREALLASQLRKDEEASKPRVLGKDQTLYTPDSKGVMRVSAQGSEVGKPKMVTSDKDFANHVMRINKVDSLEALGEDARKRVSGIISVGENINRLNAGTPAGEVLTPGNLADLSQQVQEGTASIVPIKLGDRQFGFGVEHEGRLVRLPVSVVPKEVQDQIRARLQAVPAGAGAATNEAQAAPAAAAKAPDAAARQTPPPRPSTAAVSPAAESAEGAQLDSARTELRQAEAVVRQLRTKPPGLKAGEEARAAHAARLQQAERDVELARAAEQAAAERWARATEGSEITRAAMGRNNVEGADGQL